MKIIRSQRDIIKNRKMGLLRQDLEKVHPAENFAIIISGIRRCGKSTLLLQSMNVQEKFNYVNFEDPRLIDFVLRDYEILEEVFLKDQEENDLYYFDEIQNLFGW